MKLLSIALASILLAQIPSAAQELIHADWQVTDIGLGVKPSFDFGTDGAIHVMGMTETPDDGHLWYAKAATIAGPWTPDTVAEGYFYGPGDLRVDKAGKAHIAWHDHSNEAPQHVLVAPDGMTTTSYVLDSPGAHDGWDNSLVIAPSGTVHMACVNPSIFGAEHSLQYASFDGSSWTFECAVAGSGAFMYGLNTSIALDSAGKPHVLYCQSGGWFEEGILIHATAGSPDWTFEGITDGSGIGRFPTLAIDADDCLHATWLDVDPFDHSKGTIQYGTRASGAGAGWAISPVAVLDDLFLEFSGARKSASIALDSNGDPRIAYADTRTINYAILNDGMWEKITVLEQPAAIYKSLAVLRFDSEDRPGIALWQSDGGVDTVRLARPVSGSPPATLDLGLDINGTTVSYTTAAAGSYQLESSPDLKTWQPVGDPSISNGTPTEISATTAQGDRRYYRVAYQP